MAATDSSILPFEERPDLSPFIVHLTKNTKNEDEYDAFDNLVSILMTGEIFGSQTATGFIKGKSPATCFMDVPLNSLKYVLNKRNTDPEHPRYEAYGIVLPKKLAYLRGCRPVLYLSNTELAAFKVPENELWRVVRFEGVNDQDINWLHEREWRSKDSFKLPKEILAVLVKNTSDAIKLRKLIEEERSNFKVIPKSIIPLTILCQGLPY